MKNLLWILALAFATNACVSFEEMTRHQCDNMHWAEQGTRDALDGKAANNDLLLRCEGAGIPPNRKAYLDAYSEGLRRFCTKEYGLYFGRNSGQYQSTCPPEGENAFLAGYSQGQLERQSVNAQQQQAEAVSNMWNPSPGPRVSCNFDMDCVRRDVCDWNMNNHSCRLSKRSCETSMDCETKGVCEQSFCRWN